MVRVNLLAVLGSRNKEPVPRGVNMNLTRELEKRFPIGLDRVMLPALLMCVSQNEAHVGTLGESQSVLSPMYAHLDELHRTRGCHNLDLTITIRLGFVFPHKIILVRLVRGPEQVEPVPSGGDIEDVNAAHGSGNLNTLPINVELDVTVEHRLLLENHTETVPHVPKFVPGPCRSQLGLALALAHEAVRDVCIIPNGKETTQLLRPRNTKVTASIVILVVTLTTSRTIVPLFTSIILIL